MKEAVHLTEFFRFGNQRASISRSAKTFYPPTPPLASYSLKNFLPLYCIMTVLEIIPYSSEYTKMQGNFKIIPTKRFPHTKGTSLQAFFRCPMELKYEV